jgi:hypothetical protein
VRICAWQSWTARIGPTAPTLVLIGEADDWTPAGRAPSFPSSVGNRNGRPDCQGGELIDRVAASAPVRELLFVEALGYAGEDTL